MIQFLKDAIREFKHVVWPTRKETQKFFSLVLAMLVFFGLYLFLASNIFSEIIFGLKSLLGPESTPSVSSSLSQDEIDSLFSNEAQIEVSGEDSASGTVIETVLDIVEESTASGEVSQ
jgi:preprotein translocase SecE subunit